MDKRYQFFISSTFTDLKDERQAVLKAVLELDHMPAGMELFPASDDSAWQLIRDVIDRSDYYLLIVGGRYGSVDEEGIAYTEREYDYALQTKKPVIALLHESPGTLPRDKTETEEIAWKNLQAFRAKVEKKHTCVYWKTAEDLKAKIIVAMTSEMKRRPAVGWVRADRVPSGSTLADVLALRNRIAELEAEVKAVAMTPPAGTADLQQGDDVFQVQVKFEAWDPDAFQGVTHTRRLRITWNDIFAGVAPTMINEAAEEDVRSAFRSFFRRRGAAAFKSHKDFKEKKLVDYSFRDDQIQTCIVQLRALGLIKESSKQRSLRDTNTYWRLTPYGDNLMTQLRALRRAELAESEGEQALDVQDDQEVAVEAAHEQDVEEREQT
jgi:hypothetical protein